MDRYQIIRIIHDYMSRYEKKTRATAKNVFGCRSLSFFSISFMGCIYMAEELLNSSLFTLRSSFSILLLIRFPIFR